MEGECSYYCESENSDFSEMDPSYSPSFSLGDSSSSDDEADSVPVPAFQTTQAALSPSVAVNKQSESGQLLNIEEPAGQDGEVIQRGRKRSRNPEKWSRQKNNKLRARGSSYINRVGLLNQLMKALQNDAATSIKNGFRKCGIVPLNPSEVLNILPDVPDSPDGTPQVPASGDLDKSLYELLSQMRYGQNNNLVRRRRKKLQVAPGQSVSIEEHSGDEEEEQEDGNETSRETDVGEETESDVQASPEVSGNEESSEENLSVNELQRERLPASSLSRPIEVKLKDFLLVAIKYLLVVIVSCAEIKNLDRSGGIVPINLGSAKLEATEHVLTYYYELTELFTEVNNLNSNYSVLTNKINSSRRLFDQLHDILNKFTKKQGPSIKEIRAEHRRLDAEQDERKGQNNLAKSLNQLKQYHQDCENKRDEEERRPRGSRQANEQWKKSGHTGSLGGPGISGGNPAEKVVPASCGRASCPSREPSTDSERSWATVTDDKDLLNIIIDWDKPHQGDIPVKGTVLGKPAKPFSEKMAPPVVQRHSLIDPLHMKLIEAVCDLGNEDKVKRWAKARETQSVRMMGASDPTDREGEEKSEREALEESEGGGDMVREARTPVGAAGGVVPREQRKEKTKLRPRKKAGPGEKLVGTKLLNMETMEEELIFFKQAWDMWGTNPNNIGEKLYRTTEEIAQVLAEMESDEEEGGDPIFAPMDADDSDDPDYEPENIEQDVKNWVLKSLNNTPDDVKVYVSHGHRMYHCLKFQSTVTPDGLINLLGPFDGRRHDAGAAIMFMLSCCGGIPNIGKDTENRHGLLLPTQTIDTTSRNADEAGEAAAHLEALTTTEAPSGEPNKGIIPLKG
ncbi:hypothetical protein GE061_015557 [Apolygus lucorum]|uniref:Uncharacterized protein n=1 Tax=Apolygus lucorum TaxID=248454 RepID=A0A8S9XP46_APOLU|nr:hypothetical protein GE061_015557 [Apolygus lucorum]